jgi:RNA polymerase sigma-70 factor (ECF subfamily)
MTQPQRLTQDQERGLLSRLRARDETALAELYDALAPWVLGLAFRILRDQDDAEEVVADTFTLVWTRVDRHDERRGALVPWILSIARHRALDELRRRRRWWRRAERWGEWHAAERGDAETPAPIEATIPGWPVHREVHRALASLPEEQQRVLTLAYFEGLSHSEIARRLQQPLGTVKTRIRTAQARLADALSHLKDWMR